MNEQRPSVPSTPVPFAGRAILSDGTLEVLGQARYPNDFSTATLKLLRGAPESSPVLQAFAVTFHRDKEPFCGLDRIGPVAYFSRAPDVRRLEVVRVYVTPDSYEDIRVERRPVQSGPEAACYDATLPPTPKPKKSIRRWVRRGFLLWAVFALSWLANSVRTRGVADGLLRSSPDVAVSDGPTVLEFLPTGPNRKAALVFFCGSGIHPHAYAPLLRPVADAGHSVFVVRLPYRFAPLDSHRAEAVDRARAIVAAHPEVPHWVVAGHSLGGALAARLARSVGGLDAAFVLIGTTHPKEDDLSKLDAAFTKVYATNDNIAPYDRVMAGKRLLPAHTAWIEIKGGNHSQFGHYGHQLFDGTATISREEQQAVTRDVLLGALRKAGGE